MAALQNKLKIYVEQDIFMHVLAGALPVKRIGNRLEIWIEHVCFSLNCMVLVRHDIIYIECGKDKIYIGKLNFKYLWDIINIFLHFASSSLTSFGNNQVITFNGYNLLTILVAKQEEQQLNSYNWLEVFMKKNQML